MVERRTALHVDAVEVPVPLARHGLVLIDRVRARSEAHQRGHGIDWDVLLRRCRSHGLRRAPRDRGHVEHELPDAALGDLVDREPAGRRHKLIRVGTGDVSERGQVDRRGAAADVERAHRAPGGVDADEGGDLVVVDGPLGHRPRGAAGSVERHRPTVLQLESGRVERDAPVEWESWIGARGRAGHLLADRDHTGRRRRFDVVGVAEHVAHTRREEHILDVVAVDVVGGAADRPESVFRTWISLGQHRVGRECLPAPTGWTYLPAPADRSSARPWLRRPPSCRAAPGRCR